MSLGQQYSKSVWKGGKNTAIKNVPIEEGFICSSFLKEVAILKRMDNRNIIKMKRFVVSDRILLITMELANCDFAYFLEHHKITKLRCRYIQLLRGLKYLHEHDVIHQNIHPSNILCFIEGEKLTLKYADFGIAIIGYSACVPLNYDNVYSLGFRAPEVVYKRGYDHKADVWALGCIFYRMESSRYLFSATNLKEYKKELNRFFPEYFTIIGKMLTSNPYKRIDTSDALSLLGKNDKKIPSLEVLNKYTSTRKTFRERDAAMEHLISLLAERDLSDEKKVQCLCVVDDVLSRYGEEWTFKTIEVVVFMCGSYNDELIDLSDDSVEDKIMRDVLEKLDYDFWRPTSFDYAKAILKLYPEELLNDVLFYLKHFITSRDIEKSNLNIGLMAVRFACNCNDVVFQDEMFFE